jgi:hypothetical protein
MSRSLSAALSAQTKKVYKKIRCGLFFKRKSVVPFVQPAKECTEEEEQMPSTYLGAPPLTPPEQLMAQIQAKKALRAVLPVSKPKTPHDLLFEAVKNGHELRTVVAVARPKFAMHTTQFRQQLGEDEDDLNISVMSDI